MKRNTTIGIGIIVTLLLLTTSFTMGITATEEEGLTVEKKIRDGQQWVDEINKSIGETVEFGIFISYHTSEPRWCINNTMVTDILPPCLEFIDLTEVMPSPDEFTVNDNILIWDFGDREFEDGQGICIKFITEVVSCGENVNIVNVSAQEHCGGETIYGEDTATVHVYGLEVKKEAWDPELEEWTDHLSWVSMSEPVRFRITINYCGDHLRKCMIVEDFLPECCLEYADNEDFIYPDDDLFEDPEITATPHYVKWDWSNKLFALYGGESIVIEFDANVTNYCCDEDFQNCVFVDLFGCEYPPCPPHLLGDDCMTIGCHPHPDVFEKTVWDGDNWVDEISAVLGQTVRFKLELTYYGNDAQYNLHFTDELPDCLEYANDATIEPSDVSSDNKTIWWNLPAINLSDSEVYTIEFDAIVVEDVGCCECENLATLRMVECGTQYQDGKLFTDTACVIVVENQPPSRPILEGPTSGEVDQTLTFKVLSDNFPSTEKVRYLFEWDDGTTQTWSGKKTQGVWSSFTHSFDTADTYTMKAKAKDESGLESDWSNSLEVTITGDGEPPGDENISIKEIKGGLGVTITFGNDGDQDVEAEWNVSIEGKLLSRISYTANDTIELDAGEEQSLDRITLFGFGRITVDVSIKAPGYGSDDDTKDGWVVGPFVRIKP